MTKRSVTILCSCLAALAVLSVPSVIFRQMFFSDVEGLALWITLLEALGVVVTILVAIMQLRDSKEISRGEFVIELNRSFVENESYIRIYNELQACVDGKCEHQVEGVCTCRECKITFDKSDISNYLTFFETVYLLSKRNVISFDILDDLFAYRFFLAVHSPVFQREKLLSQPENFKNIFALEKEWLAYRVKKGKLSQKDLDEACEQYREFLVHKNKGEDWVNRATEKNVYVRYQLRATLPPDRYEALTKD